MAVARILQVIGIMNRGGAETMLMNLYRHVDRSKVQFDFVVHTDQQAAFDNEIEALGGRLFHCPRFVGSNTIAYKKWWNQFFSTHAAEYSVVHGHIGSTAAIYLKIAKKYGLFTIAHSHSSGTDHSLKSHLYKALAYPTRYIADYFIACSQAAGLDRYGAKVARSDNYCILNNAIDTNFYQYNEAIRLQVREETGLGKGLVLGHVGRFDSAKNQSFAVRLFAELKKQLPEARLLLVGDGVLRHDVEALADSLGCGESVIFTGVRSDVYRLLQAMDVFVFPSVFEGLPVTLVEAQCAGLPCVISDSIPTDCIITDGLVTRQSLSQPPAEWVPPILKAGQTERTDRTAEIAAHGFDIQTTAKWLEEFYLEHSKG